MGGSRIFSRGGGGGFSEILPTFFFRPIDRIDFSSSPKALKRPKHSRNSTKGGPFGSAGGRIPKRGGVQSPPPPPLNPPLISFTKKKYSRPVKENSEHSGLCLDTSSLVWVCKRKKCVWHKIISKIDHSKVNSSNFKIKGYEMTVE